MYILHVAFFFFLAEAPLISPARRTLQRACACSPQVQPAFARLQSAIRSLLLFHVALRRIRRGAAGSCDAQPSQPKTVAFLSASAIDAARATDAALSSDHE